jgi:uncharacterized protein
LQKWGGFLVSDKMEKNNALVKKRIEAVIKKAVQGDIYSMRLIAHVYSEGGYFPKDFFAAESWLRKAAELGSVEAKKQLAKLLTEGDGIAQNLEEAFDIHHELMLDCDIDAMAEVGLAYKLGKGVPQDDAKASFYIKHAFDIELGLTN